MAIVFELIVVAILAVFVLLGIKRGLVLSLCGLVGVLIAFGGAGVLARTLSPMVADALAAEEAVTDMYLMTGASKLHVHAVLEMNQDLEHFVMEKLYPLPGIEHISSELIISRIKTRKGIRI